MDEIKKICTVCGVEKPITEFYLRAKRPSHQKYERTLRKKEDGHRSDCNICCRKRANSYYKRLDYLEQRKRNIRQKYGITLEQYSEVLLEQGGGCGICGGEVNGKGGVDHCHSTGKIRGILCAHCNAAIGHMNDDIERLKKAIVYLERYGEGNGS